jgi:glycosyltransferase involved in cell wall biosynthesis
MKVVHVGPKNYPPSHGGTERVVYDIVSGSKETESYILVEFEQEEKENIKVMPNGYFKKLRFIAKYVKEEKIDIVHFHNETFVPLALMYSLINKKNLVTVHGCHFTNPKYNWFQRLSILVFDIIGAIFLPRLVFCSEVDRNKFKKWVPFRKIYFVPNGVNLSNIYIDYQKKQKDVFVYLGRISPEKNLLRLIEAANISQRTIHIYGAFDERRPEFNEIINNALNNSRYAVWKGSIPYSKVLHTLSHYETFVYPSVSEGLPLSVLEAASCGLKLILSDIPQHKILNFPGVKYIDPFSFNLDISVEELNGTLNRKHAEEHFSINKMVLGYHEIYNSLL